MTTTAYSFEKLDNGMDAILVPSAANHIVAVKAFLGLPGAVEQEAEAGLVRFTLRMLHRGTVRLGAAELAEAIESLGSEVAFSAQEDYSFASMDCTADSFGETLDLFARMLREPAFEPEEIEKERVSTIASIARRDDSRSAYAMRHLLRDLYGSHSYGLSRMGYEESVAGFTREQLMSTHQELVDTSRWLIVAVGNFDADALRADLCRLFPGADTPTEPAFLIPPVQRVPPATRRIERPGEQAIILIGHPAPPVASPDFPAVRLLNAILGESMSSRFFVRLRDEQGLAYSTGSAYTAHTRGAHIVGHIETKPASLDEARDGMLAEFRSMAEAGVSQDELDRARNYVLGKFLIDHQTNHRRALYLGHYTRVGLGPAMDTEYPAILAKVTPRQVRDAAAKYLTTPTLVELIPPA